MKRELSSEVQGWRRIYKATSVHPEARMLIARVADAYAAEGVSYKRQREIYSEAGYEISRPSFNRYLASMHDGETPLSTDKHAGLLRYA